MLRVLTIGAVLVAAGFAAASPKPSIGSPPAHLRVDPYYSKYLDARGIPILAHASVRDEALHRLHDLVGLMLANKDDGVRALVGQTRFVIVPADAPLTSIPEYADLKAKFPATDWDARARGLGATKSLPLTSCREENLLQLPGDRYKGESICVHEFAHTLHMAFATIDPTLDKRLRALHAQAISSGAIFNTYAAQNIREYYAEGVQSWFNVNICRETPNGIHNHVCTNAALEIYDPALHRLLSQHYRRP
jgi:hypothetical protein